MEKKNENERFDKLMEKYNFDSPIEVTVVIEEEDPPVPVFLKALLVSNNTNVPKTNVYPNSLEIYKNPDSNTKDTKIRMLNVKKKCISKSVVGESNHSLSVFKPVLPEGYQKGTQYIQWQLLDAVADNLIHITKYHYYNFIKSKMQISKRLSLEYLALKHYFFNLSYSTTITILLPQENDILFFKTFICRIIKIANRSSWFQITYERLDTLIQEMMIWTKKKKTNLDIKLGSHTHQQGGMDSSASELRISNRLNQSNQNCNWSSNSGLITNDAMQGINTQPLIVSKTKLPVQKPYISPSIRHITNYSTNELSSPLNVSTRANYLMQDINSRTSSSHIKNNAKSKETKRNQNNRSETFHSQPEINISPYFISKLSHSDQETSNPYSNDRRINNSIKGISRVPVNGSNIDHLTETITSNHNIEPETNSLSSCQAIKPNRSKVILSSGPPNQKVTISIDSEILAKINYKNTIEGPVNEAYETKSIKRRRTNDSSYYPFSNLKSLPHHNDNNIHYHENHSSVTNLKSPVDGLFYDNSRKAGYQLLTPDTMRSSISRDSGCESPSNGSSLYEQTIETPNNEQDTPIISHVTSLNPNVARLNVGFCKVCGETTNNMCIGCYQEYYCSYLCQTKGWENHKYICSG